MRRDHKPYSIKKLQGRIESFWVRHFTTPQLDSLGPHSMIMKPWNLSLYGKKISLGKSVHIITARDRPVNLTTWNIDDSQGEILIGDFALICPGVRIDSASRVTVGKNCMLAAGAYLTDADWHDIYDRTKTVGETSPITLEENVWIGDGATLCKGVTIGENSIIGAGSVVTKSIPKNVVAAGNPATVVKNLDTEKEIVTRQSLLEDHSELAGRIDALEKWIRADNTLTGWLRSIFWPNRKD